MKAFKRLLYSLTVDHRQGAKLKEKEKEGKRKLKRGRHYELFLGNLA
jgi:hypothetical protein